MTYYPHFAEIVNDALARLDRSPAWLARRLKINQSTVSRWLNQGARPGDPETVVQIADVLGVSNHVQELLAAAGYGYQPGKESTSEDGLTTPSSSIDNPGPTPHNLPAALTPLIGREREIAELENLLTSADVRLLTIIGPGGTGKTRLAQAVAMAALSNYPQGAYFVELAPHERASDLPLAVADALQISIQSAQKTPHDQILAYLADRQLLLVLDNFEHLLDGATFVRALLQAAPLVDILVTSRERLRLSGETLFELGGMDLPTENGDYATEMDYSAIRLFVQSAQRVRSSFELTPDNWRDVARICRLVHGMPLAILLAAAWIEVLSPQEIASETARSIDFLASDQRDLPPRQRSISAVFASSWQRLNAREQAAFMRLAVFHGGVTRAAAEQVAQASLPILSRLIGSSFLQRDSVAESRYQIHELLRQYAEEELRKAHAWDATRDAHSAYYADLLHRLEADLKGKRQLAALQEIEADWENIRAAWQWAVQTRDYATIDRSLESIYWFCIMRSRLPGGQELLHLAQRELAPRSGEEAHPVWGRVMARAMKTNIRYLEPAEDVKARVLVAMSLAEAHNDRQEIAFCLWALGMTYVTLEEPVKALPYFEKSLALYQDEGDLFDVAWLLYYVGLCRSHAHLPDTGELGQSLEIRRELGDRIGTAYSLHEIGMSPFMRNWLQISAGRDEYAGVDAPQETGETEFMEAYAIQREMGNRQGMCENLPMLATLAMNTGDLPRAAVMAQEMYEIASDMNSIRHKAIAEVILGRVAYTENDFSHSGHHFDRAIALATGHDRGVLEGAEFGLSLIAWARKKPSEARQHLLRSLRYGIDVATITTQAEHLVQAALLLTDSGELERATQLLSFASPQAAIVDPRCKHLEAELQSNLSDHDFAQAWARGKTLRWETTRDELISALSRNTIG